MGENINRRYITFSFSEVDDVDFTQIEETSSPTLRKSVDELLAVIKYELPAPSSVDSLTTKSQEYTHSEILALMITPAWSHPDII
tara:strand:+ start:158 stop:412 length:255 start_codon:yes stop_codon:yes gene_type:complete